MMMEMMSTRMWQRSVAVRGGKQEKGQGGRKKLGAGRLKCVLGSLDALIADVAVLDDVVEQDERSPEFLFHVADLLVTYYGRIPGWAASCPTTAAPIPINT